MFKLSFFWGTLFNCNFLFRDEACKMKRVQREYKGKSKIRRKFEEKGFCACSEYLTIEWVKSKTAAIHFAINLHGKCISITVCFQVLAFKRSFVCSS